jgi:multidrug efflux pump subunit AcrA (membrane-fusion protein)
LELVATVDEADIGDVRRGDPVVFTVEAFPSLEREGVVVRINPTGTLVSGVVNYEVVVALRAAAARGLKPDMTADVTMRTARREALVVPDAAVHRRGDAHFIYLARDGHLEQRNVSIGIRRDGWTEIRSGARAEDYVLVGDPRAAAEKGGKSWWNWTG